jgi:hypothetical protein
MLGLMYLGAAALYFALMFFVVLRAWRIGRANGGSRLKGAGFALVGFLVVYLPVFWNWAPTAIAHRRMCETDAGFTVNVKAEHWIAAHGDDLARLGEVDPNSSTNSKLTPRGYWRSTFMGGLLATETRDTQSTYWGMPLWRHEIRVIDVSSDRVLAQAVNYALGSPEDARIWLTRRSCFDNGSHPITRITAYKTQLKGALK